jgi:glutathione S-transferase
MIRLHHGGPVGHSASVLIALAEKGLEYESDFVDLAEFEELDPAFLALNPSGQVPVLEAGGHVLTEAFFILLWLDETYPDPPLGGADPRARYAVHKWGKYVETHLAPNLAIVRWARRGGAAPDAADLARLPPERRALWQRAATGFGAEEVERARAALDKALARMVPDLAQSGWLAGADYTLADIALYPHVAQLDELGIGVPAPVGEWLARVAARPAVRQAAGEMPVLATMGPEPGRWG